MSANHNNARLAAMEVENVYVLDTKNLSTGGGLLVIAAAEMAQNGASAEEICEKVSACENGMRSTNTPAAIAIARSVQIRTLPFFMGSSSFVSAKRVCLYIRRIRRENG